MRKIFITKTRDLNVVQTHWATYAQIRRAHSRFNVSEFKKRIDDVKRRNYLVNRLRTRALDNLRSR